MRKIGIHLEICRLQDHNPSRSIALNMPTKTERLTSIDRVCADFGRLSCTKTCQEFGRATSWIELYLAKEESGRTSQLLLQLYRLRNEAWLIVCKLISRDDELFVGGCELNRGSRHID
jgi:hypothetical protein